MTSSAQTVPFVSEVAQIFYKTNELTLSLKLGFLLCVVKNLMGRCYGRMLFWT